MISSAVIESKSTRTVCEMQRDGFQFGDTPFIAWVVHFVYSLLKTRMLLSCCWYIMYIANRQYTVIETHFFYYSTYLREYSEPFGVPILETIIANLHLTQLYELCYWVHRRNANMQPRGLTIKEVKVPTDMNSLNEISLTLTTFQTVQHEHFVWTTLVNHELPWYIMNYVPCLIMNYHG